MIRKSLAILLCILSIAFVAKADIAPMQGYSRVSLDLVLKTNENLSKYRFFVDFYGDLNEIKVKNKSTTTIPSIGGGARYRIGKLLAIPVSSLKNFKGKLTREKSSELTKLIENKQIAGIVELAEHTFAEDIKDGESAETYIYEIKREGNSLKAEKIAVKINKSETKQSALTPNSRINQTVAGFFMTFGILIFGLLMFRKKSD